MSTGKMLALFAACLIPCSLNADVILPFAITGIYAFTFWIQFLFGILIEYWVLWFLFNKSISSQRVFKLVAIMNLYSVLIGFVIAALDDFFRMGIRHNLVSSITLIALSFIGAVIANVLLESPVAFWMIPEISKRKMIIYIAIANMCSVGFYLIGLSSFFGLVVR